MQLSNLIEITLHGIGYELIACEKIAHGLLRIYIDFPFQYADKNVITLDDCKNATHQLLRVLTVENINFKRLEVSSPGLNRPLKTLKDYIRFAHEKAIIKLRTPISKIDNRKLFQGILCVPEGENLKLEFETHDRSVTILEFTLADVDKAHLVPTVNFRSRKA